jgi:nitrite reductase/ring-hydroxylating ferredoxin subunit
MNDSTGDDWHRVAKTDDVLDDEPKAVQIGNDYIALYRLDDKFYATDDICTHEFASLAEGFVDGDCIECPLHAGKFHIPTGKAMTAPVTEDIRTYPVKVEGGEIFVNLAKG